METQQQRISGIFPHLVNAAAFVDKVEIAVWGKKRTTVLNYIRQKKNRAIGGFGRSYARCIPGRNIPTGNPLQLKYGLMLPYRNRSLGKRLGRPPLRVLTPKDIRELRKERLRTKAPFRTLATKYKISVWSAYRLCGARPL